MIYVLVRFLSIIRYFGYINWLIISKFILKLLLT